MTRDTGADELCRLIVGRVDGVGSVEWMGGSVYVYGGGPNDAILPGVEHNTTVLTVGHDGPRWFQLDVREFDPSEGTIVNIDHDVLRSLAQRAGITPPPFSS